jgi:hypothetical protein
VFAARPEARSRYARTPPMLVCMFARDDDPEPLDPLRAEQFDALVQELLPLVRELWPHLDTVAALRATARMAEFRLRENGRLTWGPPRI